jgi:hypothetical protein
MPEVAIIVYIYIYSIVAVVFRMAALATPMSTDVPRCPGGCP